jgi:hypothetical protein
MKTSVLLLSALLMIPLAAAKAPLDIQGRLDAWTRTSPVASPSRGSTGTA